MEIGVVILVVAVLAVLVAAALLVSRKRRSSRLREQYGDEYERTVHERGGRREAERDLVERQEQRRQLEIRPLDPVRRQELAASWQQVQARFVDEPVEAVAEADRLVRTVMSERGYPTDDFDRQADTVSVDHPEVVGDYRSAHRISEESREGRVTTEQLREAMVHYRSLFGRLLDSEGSANEGNRR